MQRYRSGHNGADSKSCDILPNHRNNFIWKRIEVVVTSRTRNAVVRKGTWVRIPPLPPNKNRNFDTIGIKVAVLSFCLKALISREFGLLFPQPPPDKEIACRQPSSQRHWVAAGYRLIYGYRLICGLSFNCPYNNYKQREIRTNSKKPLEIYR